MSDKTDLVVEYRDQIRWVQKADAYALATFLDECSIAKDILQLSYHIAHDITELFPKLTENQKAVVRLAMDGLSYEEIGKELGKASSTVADAMQRAMLKMGAPSKEKLLLVGRRLLQEAFDRSVVE